MVLYLATTKVNFLKAVTSYMKILYLIAGILGICHKEVIQSIKKLHKLYVQFSINYNKEIQQKA